MLKKLKWEQKFQKKKKKKKKRCRKTTKKGEGVSKVSPKDDTEMINSILGDLACVVLNGFAEEIETMELNEDIEIMENVILIRRGC